MRKNVESQHWFFPTFHKPSKEQPASRQWSGDIFFISYTQFCRVCLGQWKLNIEEEIKDLQQIFYDNANGAQGAITLDDFWGMLLRI